VEINVTSHREPEPLDPSGFVRLAEFVLIAEEAPLNCELSIALVDLDEMTELNGEYRGKDGPTDVLSFECDDPCAVASADQPVMLGDVIIAPEVAIAQAKEYGHTVEEELNLLLVHGILHLLGYDHIEDADAEAMQARERVVLSAWMAESA